MKLGDLLKVFLDYSGASITELAKVLGYDRSYLSKWVNNRELPVENKWASINESLALFFTDKISDFDFQRILLDFYIEDNLKNTSKYEVLKYILNKCYLESSVSFSMVEKYNKTKFVKYLKDKNEITNYIKKLLIEDYLDLDDDAVFYYYGNIINIFNEKAFEKSVTNIISPKTINVKFSTWDFTKERKPSLDLLNDYLLMISNENNIKIELYNNHFKDERLNAFAVRNCVFGWGFSGNDFVPNKFFVSENKEQVKKNIFRLDGVFEKDKEVLTLIKNPQEIINDLYKKKVIKNRPICFIPRANIYLSNLKLREKLYKERQINGNEYKLWGLFYEVFISLQKKGTKFIFLSENINYILTDGLIYRAGGIHKLYGDSLDILIHDMSNLFRNYEHVEMINKNDVPFEKIPNCIVYSDGEEVEIMKFSQATPYNFNNILYKSSDRDFCNLVYQYLESLLDENLVRGINGF